MIDSACQALQEIFLVVQLRDRITVPQFGQFSSQFALCITTTDLNLIAWLVAVGGVAETHGHRKLLTIRQNARGFELKAIRYAGAVLLQEILKTRLTVRGNHVHDRHALEVFNRFITEHFKIGRICMDMHAIMNVSNRIA